MIYFIEMHIFLQFSFNFLLNQGALSPGIRKYLRKREPLSCRSSWSSARADRLTWDEGAELKDGEGAVTLPRIPSIAGASRHSHWTKRRKV